MTEGIIFALLFVVLGVRDDAVVRRHVSHVIAFAVIEPALREDERVLRKQGRKVIGILLVEDTLGLPEQGI